MVMFAKDRNEPAIITSRHTAFAPISLNYFMKFSFFSGLTSYSCVVSGFLEGALRASGASRPDTMPATPMLT